MSEPLDSRTDTLAQIPSPSKPPHLYSLLPTLLGTLTPACHALLRIWTPHCHIPGHPHISPNLDILTPRTLLPTNLYTHTRDLSYRLTHLGTHIATHLKPHAFLPSHLDTHAPACPLTHKLTHPNWAPLTHTLRLPRTLLPTHLHSYIAPGHQHSYFPHIF